MIQVLRNTYLPGKFFLGCGVIVLLFIMAFPYPVMIPVAQTVFALFVATAITDVILLNGKQIILRCFRVTPKLFSLGNQNEVKINIINESNINIKTTIIDELPYQLQIRDFEKHLNLEAGEALTAKYEVRPLVRGEYSFGKMHVYVQSKIGLTERRISFDLEENVAVYPSIIDMKKFELRSAATVMTNFGIKKIRRIGHSYEFEQIKEYTIGDDYQSINWKATGRANKLMINSYTDEKAQQVYCLIDKSRYMKMPFNGLSLLDYSINSSLVIANTSLQKQDRAGLITFSDKVESMIIAEKQRYQLRKILDALYKEKESRLDANYELLYANLRRNLRGRSLIFLFTNFESMHSLERVLPVLRKINKLHLLVVVVFENYELKDYYSSGSSTLKDIYYKTVAHKIAGERELIINELKHYGIQHIYTQPDKLSINAINKYLELKSRGMI